MGVMNKIPNWTKSSSQWEHLLQCTFNVLYVGEQHAQKHKTLKNKNKNKNSYLSALIIVVASSKIIELCTYMLSWESRSENLGVV